MRRWSGRNPCSRPHRTACGRVETPILRYRLRMYDLIELIDRHVNCGDVGVAAGLGDEGQDLGLPIGQPLAPPGPVLGDAVRPRWRRADDHLTAVDRLQRGDQLGGRERLGQVAAGSLGQGALDEGRLEVPRVDGDAPARGLAVSTSRSSWSASAWANVSYSATSTSWATGWLASISTISTRSRYCSNILARPARTTS